MKTKFSIIQFFDPFGDMKSQRKQLNRKNYESDKTLSEVNKIVERYNDGKYYNAIAVSSFRPGKGEVKNFDTSYFTTSKARPARYEHIPGF